MNKSIHWQITFSDGGTMTVSSLSPITRDEALKRAKAVTKRPIAAAAPIFDR